MSSSRSISTNVQATGCVANSDNIPFIIIENNSLQLFLSLSLYSVIDVFSCCSSLTSRIRYREKVLGAVNKCKSTELDNQRTS